MFSFTGETSSFGNLSEHLMKDHNDAKAVGIATTEWASQSWQHHLFRKLIFRKTENNFSKEFSIKSLFHVLLIVCTKTFASSLYLVLLQVLAMIQETFSDVVYNKQNFSIGASQWRDLAAASTPNKICCRTDSYKVKYDGANWDSWNSFWNHCLYSEIISPLIFRHSFFIFVMTLHGRSG